MSSQNIVATQTASVPVVTEAGTTRTLTAADINTYIRCTNAAGCTITVPSGVYTVGQWTNFYTAGTGQITFVASSTTIASKLSNLKTSTTGSPASLMCTTTSTDFDLVGDLSA